MARIQLGNFGERISTDVGYRTEKSNAFVYEAMNEFGQAGLELGHKVYTHIQDSKYRSIAQDYDSSYAELEAQEKADIDRERQSDSTTKGILNVRKSTSGYEIVPEGTAGAMPIGIGEYYKSKKEALYEATKEKAGQLGRLGGVAYDRRFEDQAHERKVNSQARALLVDREMSFDRDEAVIKEYVNKGQSEIINSSDLASAFSSYNNNLEQVELEIEELKIAGRYNPELFEKSKREMQKAMYTRTADIVTKIGSIAMIDVPTKEDLSFLQDNLKQLNMYSEKLLGKSIEFKDGIWNVKDAKGGIDKNFKDTDVKNITAMRSAVEELMKKLSKPDPASKNQAGTLLGEVKKMSKTNLPYFVDNLKAFAAEAAKGAQAYGVDGRYKMSDTINEVLQNVNNLMDIEGYNSARKRAVFRRITRDFNEAWNKQQDELPANEDSLRGSAALMSGLRAELYGVHTDYKDRIRDTKDITSIGADGILSHEQRTKIEDSFSQGRIDPVSLTEVALDIGQNNLARGMNFDLMSDTIVKRIRGTLNTNNTELFNENLSMLDATVNMIHAHNPELARQLINKLRLNEDGTIRDDHDPMKLVLSNYTIRTWADSEGLHNQIEFNTPANRIDKRNMPKDELKAYEKKEEAFRKKFQEKGKGISSDRKEAIITLSKHDMDSAMALLERVSTPKKYFNTSGVKTLTNVGSDVDVSRLQETIVNRVVSGGKFEKNLLSKFPKGHFIHNLKEEDQHKMIREAKKNLEAEQIINAKGEKEFRVFTNVPVGSGSTIPHNSTVKIYLDTVEGELDETQAMLNRRNDALMIQGAYFERAKGDLHQ